MSGRITPDGTVFVRTLIDGVEQLITLDKRGGWVIQTPGDAYDAVLVMTQDGDRVYRGFVRHGDPDSNCPADSSVGKGTEEGQGGWKWHSPQER